MEGISIFNEQALKSLDFQLPQLKGGVEINIMRANSSVSLKINIEKEREKKRPVHFDSTLMENAVFVLLKRDDNGGFRWQLSIILISASHRGTVEFHVVVLVKPLQDWPSTSFTRLVRKKNREILYVDIKILKEECRPSGYPTRVL